MLVMYAQPLLTQWTRMLLNDKLSHVLYSLRNVLDTDSFLDAILIIDLSNNMICEFDGNV